MNPDEIGASTVTFRTTAVAPVGGTPPTPVTLSSVRAWLLSAEMLPPVPSRVSSSRDGFNGTKQLGVEGTGRSMRTGPVEYAEPTVLPPCTVVYTQYVPFGIPLPSQLNVLVPAP